MTPVVIMVLVWRPSLLTAIAHSLFLSNTSVAMVMGLPSEPGERDWCDYVKRRRKRECPWVAYPRQKPSITQSPAVGPPGSLCIHICLSCPAEPIAPVPRRTRTLMSS